MDSLLNNSSLLVGERYPVPIALYREKTAKLFNN